MKPEKITYTWHMNGVSCNTIGIDDEAVASEESNESSSSDLSEDQSPEAG